MNATESLKHLVEISIQYIYIYIYIYIQYIYDTKRIDVSDVNCVII